MIGVGSDVGPDEANEDGSVIESLLTVELATTVLELAYERCVQGAIIDIDERLAPLMGFGVVEKKRHSFEGRGGVAGFELLQVGAPIPYFSDSNGTVRFNPSVGASERMNEEADMRVPCAKVEVEVVLPVAKLLRGCRSLGGDRKGVRTKANGEKKKI